MKLSKHAKKLAADLGLSDVDAYLMELKSNLYQKAAKEIKSSDLTHQEIAKLVGTSRARITRLANMGENNVSIELLIKVIGSIEKEIPLKYVA